MQVYGHKIIDWAKIHDVAPEQRKALIIDAVVKFMAKVAEFPHANVKMTGADPTLVPGINPVVHRLTDTLAMPDRGYEVLFDEVNMRQSTSKSFDLLDISGGVTFHQQAPGEEAELSKLPTASKASVSMLRFTGGFPILDDWLRFNEYYKIDELAADTVRRWWNQKATLFYSLITALASIDESFATDDVTTINNACAKILTDMEAAGYAVDENEQFYIIAHPNLRQRIMKALAASFTNPNSNSSSEIVWGLRGVISTTKIPATSYYVALAGHKNKRGEWEDLNAREPQRNELKLGADHVWTGAYNGAIGESKQFRKCALS